MTAETKKLSKWEREFFAAYIECALWSSSVGPCEDNDYDENDDTSFESAGYDQDDLADETVGTMLADCKAFLDYVEDRGIDIYAYDAGHAGHDFWLTRNRHGAGYWDGDYADDDGDALTDAAHIWGEQDLYLGDDGLIYVC